MGGETFGPQCTISSASEKDYFNFFTEDDSLGTSQIKFTGNNY